MPTLSSNIRPNLAGDHPVVHPSSLIDPSAQIIGNVRIAANAFIGPLTVIRADELGTNGRVEPIVIEEGVNIQDGVIIHSHGGKSVTIGRRTSVAHGVAIHGPCTIGADCFLSMRSMIYRATIEDSVWIGMGAIIMQVTLQSHVKVPEGAIIRGLSDLMGLRHVSHKEQTYMDEVHQASSRLRKDYLELMEKAQSLRDKARTQ
ncbi:MAG: carbonate dehydratase [Deltaproteobacteria bacterium]|nr:carbonate dehydratase [Deltaproteobacteria bacterium]